MNFSIRKSIVIFALVSIPVFLVGSVMFTAEIPKSEKDVSSWKTFRSDEYGFEFKYPSERKRISITEDDSKFCTPGMCVTVKNNNEKIGFFGTRKNIADGRKKLLLWNVFIDGVLGWAYTKDEDNYPERMVLVHGDNIFTFYSGFRIDRDILSTFKFVD